jgi:hypothetical protein
MYQKSASSMMDVRSGDQPGKYFVGSAKKQVKRRTRFRSPTWFSDIECGSPDQLRRQRQVVAQEMDQEE